LDLARRRPGVAGLSLLSVVDGDRPRIFPRRACRGKADPCGRLLMRSVVEHKFSSLLQVSDSSTCVRTSKCRNLEVLGYSSSHAHTGSVLDPGRLSPLRSRKILSPVGLASHLVQHGVFKFIIQPAARSPLGEKMAWIFEFGGIDGAELFAYATDGDLSWTITRFGSLTSSSSIITNSGMDVSLG
jgi:hypothetical protein